MQSTQAKLHLSKGQAPSEYFAICDLTIFFLSHSWKRCSALDVFNGHVKGIVLSHSGFYWEWFYLQVQPKSTLIESPAKELLK